MIRITEEIKKETAAGTVTIEVAYSGCDSIRASLNGKEVGSGIIPLAAAREIRGRLHVARCGKVALTQEDVSLIETVLAKLRTAWMDSEAGKEYAADLGKLDRIADRQEEIARKAEAWENEDNDGTRAALGR